MSEVILDDDDEVGVSICLIEGGVVSLRAYPQSRDTFKIDMSHGSRPSPKEGTMGSEKYSPTRVWYLEERRRERTKPIHSSSIQPFPPWPNRQTYQPTQSPE